MSTSETIPPRWGARAPRPLTLLATLGLLLAVGPGCTILQFPAPDQPRASVPLTAEARDRYDYQIERMEDLKPTWEDDEVAISEGTLQVRIPNAQAPTVVDDLLEVSFEYWRSKSAPADSAPVVVVTPILGGGKSMARSNCRDFARAGLHVILAWREVKVMKRHWGLEDVEAHMRRAVAARRALVDWALTRPEIDGDRIAAFGISMGGIVTSVLLGVEERIHSGVVALAGGDIASVLRVSTEGRLVRFRETKCEEAGIDVEALERRFREVFVSDPLAVAASVDPERVFFVSARYDTVVPPENQERLWTAMGRPLRYDLPTAHYTGALFLPTVTDLIVDWFHQRLRPGPRPRTEVAKASANGRRG